MNASLEQQQSLLRLKLIQAGNRIQNTTQADDSYDEVAESEEISDTESYDTVCNEGRIEHFAFFEELVFGINSRVLEIPMEHIKPKTSLDLKLQTVCNKLALYVLLEISKICFTSFTKITKCITLNKGPYRPCPAQFETLVSHGTLEHDYEDVANQATFDCLKENLRKMNYRGYVWGVKEWTIYILRTSKLKLMWRFLIYLINIFLESYAVEILLRSGSHIEAV